MKTILTLVLLGFSCLLVISTPLRRVHLRQLPPVQIAWVTSSTTRSVQETTTVFGSVAVDKQVSYQTSNQENAAPTPILWMPSVAGPASLGPSVSISTVIETVEETFTTTVYENPKTVTVTAAPTTITNTITVSEPFTATPGSFWSVPEQFSNLDSFKIAHFACGEKNLQITDGIPPDVVDDSLAVNLPGLDNDMEASYGKDDVWNSSSALQLLYPEDSINPGNSPQGGADFYATPLPLADAYNVTLEYSVFFPKGFDWVHGGKLPGLYGGHMTCSGGDDATSCFSTRLMWRKEGAGELYLYAPKDKQTFGLCHITPESVCDSTYGLSIGRGSFKFNPGTWTNVRQTVSLNTPGKQDGGFRLEVNGKAVLDRYDVFYRDVPSTTGDTPSARPTNTGAEGDADNGGLLGPLLGDVLGKKPVDRAGVNEGILPSFAKSDNDSPETTSIVHPASGTPPLLPLQQPASVSAPLTPNNPASAIIYNVTNSRTEMSETMFGQPTVTHGGAQPTVTITNYLWAHAFDSAGKELAIPGISDDGPKPISFSGLFFSTFFGGSSEEFATPKDQYTWFKDFAITINS